MNKIKGELEKNGVKKQGVTEKQKKMIGDGLDAAESKAPRPGAQKKIS